MTCKNKLRKSYFFLSLCSVKKSSAQKSQLHLYQAETNFDLIYKQMYTAKSDRKWTFI